jgi:hypothetical protein
MLPSLADDSRASAKASRASRFVVRGPDPCRVRAESRPWRPSRAAPANHVILVVWLACGLSILALGCSRGTTESASAPAAVPASAAAAEPATDPERPRKTLIEHAERMTQATLREDHATIAELTHPRVVSELGGKERFIERVAAITADMKSSGYAITGVRLSRPADLMEDEGIFYAIVPYDLSMTGPDGMKGESQSFFVGVSLDGGDSWKFVDGAAIAGDREKLKIVMKRFPDRLVLPPVQEPRWGK